MLKVSLYRYNPETDEAPWMEETEVDTGGKDLMVLDVLELLKAKDPSLSYRRSCREGVCGSDGVNMNGKNGLACITALSETVKKNKLVVRPLPGLPVIRDLVVDMSMFYAQYEKIKPFLVNDQPAPAIERLQTPEDRKSSMDCTNVFCARVAQPAAPHSGGILIVLSVRPVCCKPIAFWPTAATLRPKLAWPSWMIRLACFVVTEFKTVSRFAPRV